MFRYVCTASTDDPTLPVVVYLHGGGWVYGTLPQHDPMGRDLAVRTGAVVAMVDYRLAPQHVFPAAVDDSWAVVRDVFDRPARYGGVPGQVAVAGDSAGGNLAAVAAWLARDAGLPLVHQGPRLPGDRRRHGHPELRRLRLRPRPEHGRHGLGRQEVRRQGRPQGPPAVPSPPGGQVGPGPGDRPHRRVRPAAGRGKAYADALEAAGVPVDYRDFPGALHGFFTFPGFFDAADEAREGTSPEIYVRPSKSRDSNQ